jgi:hypothetical protein
MRSLDWQYVVLAKASETDRPLNYMGFLFLWTGRTLDWKKRTKFRIAIIAFSSYPIAPPAISAVYRAPPESLDSCLTGKDRRSIALEPFFFFIGQMLAVFWCFHLSFLSCHLPSAGAAFRAQAP